MSARAQGDVDRCLSFLRPRSSSKKKPTSGALIPEAPPGGRTCTLGAQFFEFLNSSANFVFKNRKKKHPANPFPSRTHSSQAQSAFHHTFLREKRIRCIINPLGVTISMSGGGGVNVALIALASALAGAKLQDIVKAVLDGGATARSGKKVEATGAKGAKHDNDDISDAAASRRRDDNSPLAMTTTSSTSTITTPLSSAAASSQQKHAASPSPSPPPSRPPLKTITRKSIGSPPPRGGKGSSSAVQLCVACNENAASHGSIHFTRTHTHTRARARAR